MSEWPISDEEAARRLGVSLRALRRFLDENPGHCMRLTNRRKLKAQHFEKLEAALESGRATKPWPQDGQGRMPLGLSTSGLSKKRFGDLIELIYAVGAERGVVFST